MIPRKSGEPKNQIHLKGESGTSLFAHASPGSQQSFSMTRLGLSLVLCLVSVTPQGTGQMKITNKLGLPEALVKAVQNDGYSKGDSDFSVTELLKPARQRALQKKYVDQLSEDVSDRLYALYGQVAHLILERANVADLAEKRFVTEVAGYKISGQIDSLSIEDGILSDYKFTSAWGFRTTKPKDEFVAQLNMQRFILEKNGLHPKALQIVGLIRDFSPAAALKELTYPKAPVVIQKIPMWSMAETEDFISGRVRIHVAALNKLPECPKEDLWGGKRCKSYCSVSKWCSQYNKNLPEIQA